jgi:hypothetical protein
VSTSTSGPSPQDAVTIDCHDALGRDKNITLAIRAGRIRLLTPPGQAAVLDSNEAERLAEALLALRINLVKTNAANSPDGRSA